MTAPCHTGQMLFSDNTEHLLYLASPFVRSLQELEERDLHLADIPVHDVTRDLLAMELKARYSIISFCVSSMPQSIIILKYGRLYDSV